MTTLRTPTVSLRALSSKRVCTIEPNANFLGVRPQARAMHRYADVSASDQRSSCKRRPTTCSAKRQTNRSIPIPLRYTGTQYHTRASYATQPTVKQEPIIHDIFETVTGTWQYIVADPTTNTAVIIDPVLDYDPVTQRITTKSADTLLDVVQEKSYNISWILETHAHADHLSAASYLQKQLSQTQPEKPVIGIGKRIGQVQQLFAQRYGIPPKEHERVFNKLFDDDEVFAIGNLQGTAMHLPGHTPDHLGYRIGDNVFCGDSLFHADLGTARCDFPGGSASSLYTSARKLLSLPPHTKIWTGHDYPPPGRTEPMPYMTVQQHKEQNKHIRDGVSEEEFVEMREGRDKGLGAPRLLHQSLQVNVRAGRLPEVNEEGLRMLHLPLKVEREW